MLGFASAALAEEKTFRGIKFGVSVIGQVDECVRSSKEYAHRAYLYPIELKQAGSKTCWESHCFSPESCPATSMRTVMAIVFIDSLSDQGLLDDGGFVTEKDGNLVQLRFGIPVTDFARIESLFQAKYGKPLVAKESPWQSKGGVRTKSQLRIWTWNGLHISLEAPTRDVDHGMVLIAMKSYLEQLQKDELDRKKKGLKDL